MFYDSLFFTLQIGIVVLLSSLAARIEIPQTLRLRLPNIVWQDDVPKARDVSNELYREYEFFGRDTPYRIDNPKELYVGVTTHRIIDSTGIVHCVPAPGYHGCVLRWVARPGKASVSF